jgi:hypothetical protein
MEESKLYMARVQVVEVMQQPFLFGHARSPCALFIKYFQTKKITSVTMVLVTEYHKNKFIRKYLYFIRRFFKIISNHSLLKPRRRLLNSNAAKGFFCNSQMS